mgnify:CR=1 FL=1
MHIILIFFDIVGKSADNFLLLGLSARLCLLKPFRTLNILVKTPPRFTYRLAKPRKRGKWRELRGAFGSAHTLAWRFGTRHINHIVIFFHFSLPCRNDGIVIIRACSHKLKCSDCKANFLQSKAIFRRRTCSTSRKINAAMRKICRKMSVER